jgi:UDP-2,3-diacylglucosamine pyrophosphatase LpxH/glycosyltransferase involved in cell wall biosynthesis
MRIDIITDTFAPDINGVAMTLGRLSQGLIRSGHRVTVICSGEQPTSSTSITAIPLPGYKEVRIGLPGPFKLRKRWLKKRPDVIYVATESPLGVSAVSVASGLGIPVTTGFHTNFHEYMEQYKLKALQPAAMSYLRHIHRRAHATMAPSQEVIDLLAREGISHAHLLGRGVDTQLFCPTRRDESLRASWGATHESLVFLVVGRIAAEKNIPLAMRAFEELHATQPQARFVVVGDGPLRENWQKTQPWAHFAGMQRDEDLARHYASADVLLFPSETETFGNVVLEGMASGLAVIAYDYAAAAHHMQHEENGLKAPKGDDKAWLALALSCTNQPSLTALRNAARQTAIPLSWDHIVGRFEAILADSARTREPMFDHQGKRRKPEKFSCRTVFISDVHLGTPESKADEVVSFLKHLQCETLVLNGDIIDGWALRRGTRWQNRHSRVIRTILKKMEKENTAVIYLRGNHDDILERFLPLTFGSIRIVKEHIHLSPAGKRYLVIHGDGFDSVATNHRWLAMLGAFGYDSLLAINRFYNKWRALMGKDYYSVSKAIKSKVKGAVSFVDKYEVQLQKLAHQRECQGIICGHIHTPADKQIDDIHYLNSGDWVESLSAIIEHHDGRMELITYQEFMHRVAGEMEATLTASMESAKVFA